MQILQTVAFVSLATSALSTTTARSKLTAPFRNWLREHSEFVSGGVGCPYCMAHWYALILVLATHVVVVDGPWIVNFVVAWFSVTAIATISNGVIMRLNFLHEGEIKRLEAKLSETQSILRDVMAELK